MHPGLLPPTAWCRAQLLSAAWLGYGYQPELCYRAECSAGPQAVLLWAAASCRLQEITCGCWQMLSFCRAMSINL